MKKDKNYIIHEETLNIASEPMAIYLPASFLKNNVLL